MADKLFGYSTGLLPLETKHSRAVQSSIFAPPQRHLTVVGPVGSGKTYMLMSAIHMLCMSQPNIRVAVCRAQQKTLYTTLVETYRKILANGMRNVPHLPYHVYGGERKPESINFYNGSSISFLGYDTNASKLFGSEWALIYNCESRLLGEEAYAEAAARLRGGGFRDKWGRETYLMLSDTNASYEQHWIKSWERDSRLKLVNMSIHDNPHYSKRGKLTREGRMYMRDLRNNFVGYAWERYVLNRWVAAEGLVYGGVFDKKRHVRARPILPNEYFSICIDHSHSGTIAAAIWVTDRYNHYTHCWKCVYTTGLSIDEVFEKIESILRANGIAKDAIEVVIGDHDPSKNSDIRRRGYRRVENATKRVVGGIEVVKNWLQSDRLTFDTNLLAHRPDERLRKMKRCDEPLSEFMRYSYPQNCLDDKPIKGNDDFLDMVRYWIEYASENQRGDFVPMRRITAPKIPAMVGV